ncbi:undecaprenyl-diphosphate phosphatase [Streptomyces rectiverticillatus]|uniref:undecaprenyl-diphosphate phosphatase n=1 Tax=Streptomyces rectiverticillatus TaxID=173860 RepID=UPI003CCDEF82
MPARPRRLGWHRPTVLIYFRKDIARIVGAWCRSLHDRRARRDPDARTGWPAIVGSIPIGVLGLVLKDAIEGPFRDLRLIATTLVVMGVVLGYAGVSRSGATISGGLLIGYTREAAARYSFLLAVPAVLASGFFELKDAGAGHTAWGPTIFATVVAFVVGYAVIAWFMRFISTRSFMPFVIYRVLLGLLLFALVAAGMLSPRAGEDLG